MAYRNLERRRIMNRERMRQWRLAHGIRPRVAADPAVRFWAKVKLGGPKDCWEWVGGRVPGPHPYGKFYIRTDKPTLAHRFSWQLRFGPIPRDTFVCHHCDNPPCVNPEHLFLGTDRDNIHDMIAKGRARHPRGEAHPLYLRGDLQRGARNPNAKLTDADVAEIRRLRADGWTQQRIADKFGVHQSWVSALLRGRRP